MKKVSRFLLGFLIVALFIPNLALSKAVGNESITRGGAASVLVKYGAFEINTSGGPHFPDVPTNHPFYSAIETLANASIWTGYADGTFRPNDSINRAEFSKLLYLVFDVRDLDSEAQLPYIDVTPDAWYYGYIHALYTNGVLPERTKFRPSESASRSFAHILGQKLASLRRMVVAELLVDGFDIPENTSGGPHFSDVPTDHPYYSAIETLVNESLWTGDADGAFRPDYSVNKAEVAKLVYMVAEPISLSIRTVSMNNVCGFPSDVSEDSWYYAYVQDLYNHGVDVTDENCEFHPSDVADFSFTKAAIRGMGGEIL